MRGKLVFPRDIKDVMLKLAVNLNDSRLTLALSKANLPIAFIEDLNDANKYWSVRKEDGLRLRSGLQEDEIKNGIEVYFNIEQGKKWACDIKPVNPKKKK
jgi:hypothetical protein